VGAWKGTCVSEANLIWRVVGLGAITGSRSMAAPAALSRAITRGDVDGLEGTPFAALGLPGVSKVLRTFEIGELIGDKLPVAPSRTSPPPLIGRAAIGASVGAALFVSRGRRATVGGTLGAISALAGAYAGERVRVLGAQKLGVPALLLALLEDGVALGGSAALLR
jgi:uncharacterized membrane protein